MRVGALIISAVLVTAITGTAGAKDWTTASQPGDGSVFTFRSNRIGDTFAVVKQRTNGELECRHEDVPGLEECQDNSAKPPPDPTQPSYLQPLGRALGDVPIKWLAYHFLDGRLIGLTVSAYAPTAPRLLDMLKARYGNPSSLKNVPVQNRAGASFNNIVARWDTPDGPLVLQQRTYSVDAATITMTSSAAQKEIDKRRSRQVGASAKKAF